MTAAEGAAPDWRRLWAPRAVAVVGASAREGTYGQRALRYARAFPGGARVYAVNPNTREIDGAPCFPRLSDLPEPPDAAVLLLRHKRLADALAECAACGVGFAVVPGDVPRARWSELRRAAAGVRVVGPNGVGVIDAVAGLALSTSSALGAGRLRPGAVSVVSHSGGVLGTLLNRGQERALGFRRLVSCGQEMDLAALDFVADLLDDEATRVVACFLEGPGGDGRRFRTLAERAAERGRPLVVLWAGRSAPGRAAAATHSGRLISDADALDALTRQAGALRVETLDEMLDVAAALAARRRPAGRRVAIVSTSGGFAVHLADRCAAAGLELPAPAPGVRDALAPALGDAVANPLDVAAAGRPDAGPALAREALAAFGADPGVDVLVGADTTLLAADALAAEFLAFAARAPKPFAVCWVAGEHTMEAVRRVEEAGVLTFRTAEGCARALAACAEYAERRARAADAAPASETVGLPADDAPLRAACARSGVLTEPEAKALLAWAGVPVPRERVARSRDEAVACAAALGGPVAMKWVTRAAVHRSDAGGVLLGVEGPDAVARAYDALLRRAAERGLADRVEGILVAEMKPPGLELVVGARAVPGIGTVVLCGLGGLWVEALRDLARRVAPFDASEARAMLRELRAYPVLAGARGRPPADEAALADILARVAALALRLGDRLEGLDLNPVVVYPEGGGACALDAALVLRPDGGEVP